MAIDNIQGVVDRLTEIIEECRLKNSPLGFFAALYRKVTIRVRDGIAKNEFDNNEQMERLDVLFAKRYIDAYDLYRSGQVATQSWMLAFKAAEKNDLLIMQHLLLGINAHINLDLGIAAVETVGEQPIQNLKTDFDGINQILASMVDDVQAKIGGLSPLFMILDPIAGRLDEDLVKFSINIARDGAWKFANELYISNQINYPKAIKDRDFRIAILAENVASPKSTILKTVVGFIRLFETKKVSKIIDKLI